MTLYNGLFYQPMSDCASGMGLCVALMSMCLCVYALFVSNLSIFFCVWHGFFEDCQSIGSFNLIKSNLNQISCNFIPASLYTDICW